MAAPPLRAIVRQIERLSSVQHAPEGRGKTDRQLLDDFSARHSESAFAELVARHGAMVMRVCRRVLQHLQDAEDAFQATFIVLARSTGSIRNREAVADFLHGVAYRTAMKAKRAAARRRNHEGQMRGLVSPNLVKPTWDDVQAILDEEIQQLPQLFRAAFVICVLEGKTVPAAAAELGCKKGTVSSRVTRARQQLQKQLLRRGIKLGMLLAAVGIAEGASKAAVPVRLSETTLRYGLLVAAGKTAGEVIPSRVATLATGVTRAMLMTKIKLAAAVLFTATVFVAGAAALAREALAASDPPGVQGPENKSQQSGSPVPVADNKSENVEVKGRVVDPDGKPLAGAKVYLNYQGSKEEERSVRAKSDADGRFTFAFKSDLLDLSSPFGSWYQVIAAAEGYGPDWVQVSKPGAMPEVGLRLVKDIPIEGRILDLEGKPVQGATLRVEHIDAYDNTEEFFQTVRDCAWPVVGSKGWTGAFPGQSTILKTGADGRIRLTGVGRDRVVLFQLEGPGIEYGPVRAIARDLDTPVEPRRKLADGPAITKVYGAGFDHAALPSRLIRGVVTDKKTGLPVEGIEIRAFGTTHQTRSDKEGRYELLGSRKNSEGYRISFSPVGRVYFSTSKTFSDTLGLGPVQCDVALVSGVLAKGRVTNQTTGKPIAGARVFYDPLYPNPNVRVLGPEGAGTVPCSWAETGADGSYSIAVLPGPGALGFNARGPKETFMPAVVTSQELKDLFKDNEFHGNEDMLKVQGGPTSWTVVSQAQYNHVLLINPGEKVESLTCNASLQPAPPVPGKVVGPDGKSLAGVLAFNLAPGISMQRLEKDTFTLEGFNPRRTRILAFVDKDRKLGAFVKITGEAPRLLTVRLEECGSVTGRILDPDGKPKSGATVRVDSDALPDTGPASVKTDREGRYRIDGLVPGQTYQARFGPAPFGQYLSPAFALKPGESKDLGDANLGDANLKPKE
jgi:RNA polymerase sigma factor (sigma-70 family)